MRRVVVVLLAVVLALAGAGLVLFYTARADERAIADQQPTEVYVAREQVPSGTTLRDAERKALIEKTQVPAVSAPNGALESIDADNRSLLALSDITPGEILMDARFGSTPTGTRAIEVPPGMLAVAVELADPNRVGDFVTPGSHIAIYRHTKLVALDDSPRAEKINENDFMSTEVLLGDVLVIGMGDTALAAPRAGSSEGEGEEEEGDGRTTEPSFLVTVAVTPKQSLRLVHQAMSGEMYAALRGSDVDVNVKESVNDLTWPGGME